MLPTRQSRRLIQPREGEAGLGPEDRNDGHLPEDMSPRLNPKHREIKLSNKGDKEQSKHAIGEKRSFTTKRRASVRKSKCGGEGGASSSHRGPSLKSSLRHGLTNSRLAVRTESVIFLIPLSSGQVLLSTYRVLGVLLSTEDAGVTKRDLGPAFKDPLHPSAQSKHP